VILSLSSRSMSMSPSSSYKKAIQLSFTMQL
jgi:hypothetical protein